MVRRFAKNFVLRVVTPLDLRLRELAQTRIYCIADRLDAYPMDRVRRPRLDKVERAFLARREPHIQNRAFAAA